MKTISTDVIIIGAGPTGLSLACQFTRYGIDFVVVEKNESFTRFSKAIGVQARTLEIYDQLGLAQPAIKEGEIAVIKGLAAESLLETYNEERLANAKRLLETTDRIFEFAAGSNWLMSLFRTTVFPTVAGYVTSLDPIRKRLFPLISQIGITYRNHSLSQHTDDEAEHVRAGDRLPYFLVNGRSIFDKLKAPKFHLLVFSNGEHDSLCERFQREFGDVVDCHVVPLDARVSEIFEKENDFILFLRPDNHIAFMSSEMSLNATREYLDRIAESG